MYMFYKNTVTLKELAKTGCVIHLSVRCSFGAVFFFSWNLGLSQGRGNYEQFHRPADVDTKLLNFCEKDEKCIHLSAGKQPKASNQHIYIHIYIQNIQHVHIWYL